MTIVFHSDELSKGQMSVRSSKQQRTANLHFWKSGNLDHLLACLLSFLVPHHEHRVGLQQVLIVMHFVPNSFWSTGGEKASLPSLWRARLPTLLL